MFDALCRFTIGIFPCSHKRFDNLGLVENTIADYKCRLERNAFFGAYRLIGMMRIALKTTDISMVPAGRYPEDDVLPGFVKHRLDDLESAGAFT